ncbi:CRAL/TRIO domain-containing protein, related [Eimeria praecox]|uniref:CRAL/TRIO domain-containing protein, related n=1 Tax=Eimeria praecox TaxID=51316 RepID=U6G6U5_9EIME|nr:CRAL/TRIO domain-containing protein, related [Eimeria praecox]
MSSSPSPSPVSAGSDNSTDCFQDAVSQQLSLDATAQDMLLTPSEALAYTPQQSEILKASCLTSPTHEIRPVVLPNPGGRPVRLIFGDLDLLPHEVEGLFKVRREMEVDKELRDSPVFADERYTLRFLQGNDWDTTRCIADMRRHLKWRAANLPTPRVAVEHLLPKGFIYIHGRDHALRPILVIRCKHLMDSEVGDVLLVVKYWLEFTLGRLLVKNKVEQWRVIVDLEDCSIMCTPVGILRHVCDMLTDDFLASVNQNQIEERYGGTCANVEDFSWPVMPPGPFGA